jgi:hypothetical protein
MLLIALLVVVAVFLGSPWTRRQLPFESLLAFGLTGLVLVALLAAGHVA